MRYRGGYGGRVRSKGQRPARLLVLLLTLSLALGWWQARASRQGRRTVGEQMALTLLLPMQSCAATIGSGVLKTCSYLPRAGAMEAENTRLRTRLQRLQAENARLREQQLENGRLQRLVRLQGTLPGRALGARVIARSHDAWAPGLTLNVGSRAGVRRGQVVVTAAGLVGQVYAAGATTCLVVPLWDRSSGVACVLQRSREPGIAKGDGEGDLRLCYLRPDAQVRAGDLVLCSGVGGVFPRGLLIGRVSGVQHKDGRAVKMALVRPAVDFARLEEVVVLSGAGR